MSIFKINVYFHIIMCTVFFSDQFLYSHGWEVDQRRQRRGKTAEEIRVLIRSDRNCGGGSNQHSQQRNIEKIEDKKVRDCQVHTYFFLNSGKMVRTEDKQPPIMFLNIMPFLCYANDIYHVWSNSLNRILNLSRVQHLQQVSLRCNSIIDAYTSW